MKTWYGSTYCYRCFTILKPLFKSRSFGLEKYAKTTSRAALLGKMQRVVPWAELCVLIVLVYLKPGNWCPPVGLERMLRI